MNQTDMKLCNKRCISLLFVNINAFISAKKDKNFENSDENKWRSHTIQVQIKFGINICYRLH